MRIEECGLMNNASQTGPPNGYLETSWNHCRSKLEAADRRS